MEERLERVEGKLEDLTASIRALETRLASLEAGAPGAGAIQILLQDVPNGRPATLVAALAVYGLALTFAPRWLRRS